LRLPLHHKQIFDMITLTETEISVKQYAVLHGLTPSAVYDRVKHNSVSWRYIFPETEEYIVIERDSYIPKKSGRKRNADKV
jgi:uncharacterized protein YjaZ